MLICVITPTIAVDEDFRSVLRSVADVLSGAAYRHIVVGPRRVRDDLDWAMWGVEFLVEAEGTKGVFDAVSYGFKYSIDRYNPDFLSYINADDLLLSGFRRALESAPSLSDDPVVVYGRVVWIDSAGARISEVSVWPWRAGRRRLFAAGVIPLTQQGTIFSARLWGLHQGFRRDLRLTADSDFWVRLDESHVHFQYYDEMVAAYRIRPGQLSGAIDAVEREHRIVFGDRSLFERYLISPFWILAFRLYFVRRYLGRFFSGRRVSTKRAMREGGF